MLRNLIKSKREEGFTIIEVMIVLAIAGLIIVVVLIAVPQLQRNQRNTARQNILGRISTEIGNYAGNNNGEYPDDATANSPGNFGDTTTQDQTFLGKYLSSVDINDPSTGDPVDFEGTLSASPTPGQVDYALDSQCGVDGAVTSGSGDRTYSVRIALEGGRNYCLDNS